MTDREKMKKRLKELDDRIAIIQQWGAALTAMEEERRGILAALNGDTCPMCGIYGEGVWQYCQQEGCPIFFSDWHLR